MKKVLKAIVRYLATREIVCRLYLGDEIQPDVASPSGIVETLAWKIHA